MMGGSSSLQAPRGEVSPAHHYIQKAKDLGFLSSGQFGEGIPRKRGFEVTFLSV